MSETARVHLPTISGADCVRILVRCGYRRRSATATAGFAILERGSRTVLVPESSLLDDETLAVVLRAADVDPAEFLELLSEGETPVTGVKHKTLGRSGS